MYGIRIHRLFLFNSVINCREIIDKKNNDKLIRRININQQRFTNRYRIMLETIPLSLNH